jgi:diguanylate cyclase (GGDEF)-like protein
MDNGARAGGNAVLADHVHDGIAVFDNGGQIIYWNAAATTITGWQRSSPEVAILRTLTTGLSELRPGKWIETRRVAVSWDGAPAAAVLFNDVTAQRRLSETQQQLRDIGLIDPLTGLIGERLLRDHARRAISLAHRDGRSAGVIWVELDRFTGLAPVHSAVADEVMRQSAKKVELAIRTSDVAARPEPEALAVMLTALASSADARTIAVRLLLVLAAPCFVEGRERSVRARVGAAVFPLNNEGPDALIDAARRAAHEASRTGEQIVMAEERRDQVVGA